MKTWARLIIVILVTIISVGILAVAFAEEKKEEATYVGDNAKKCKVCHAKQVKAWQGWKMAKAIEALKDEEKKQDKCIKCHVTGFGEKGGFVSLEKTPNLANVQCEACHGPASLHLKVPLKDKEKKRATIRRPTKEDCIRCHNKEFPNFKGFDFEKSLKTIKHWEDKK